MIKTNQSIVILCLCMFANLIFANQVFAKSAQALPKNIQLEYELRRGGKLIAKVKENFSQDGKQYKITSVTKGVGIYALMGERQLQSVGEVTQEGLKPKHFELHQGDNAKKTLINDFDWEKSSLNRTIKGESSNVTLEKGTQDLLSYAYQFMFAPPISQNDINIFLTTGKKLNAQTYRVIARGVKLKAAKTQFKTLQIANMPEANDDKKQLWLAEDQFYLPVRYQLTDEDNASFEQTLTKINVE